jgi:hypothetical protein
MAQRSTFGRKSYFPTGFDCDSQHFIRLARKTGFLDYYGGDVKSFKRFHAGTDHAPDICHPLYMATGAIIYALAGQYATSPALGSAPLIPAKVAYGIV